MIPRVLHPGGGGVRPLFPHWGSSEWGTTAIGTTSEGQIWAGWDDKYQGQWHPSQRAERGGKQDDTRGVQEWRSDSVAPPVGRRGHQLPWVFWLSLEWTDFTVSFLRQQ